MISIFHATGQLAAAYVCCCAVHIQLYGCQAHNQGVGNQKIAPQFQNCVPLLDTTTSYNPRNFQNHVQLLGTITTSYNHFAPHPKFSKSCSVARYISKLQPSPQKIV